MGYLHRGQGAIKGWQTRRHNKRVRDKQITDALQAARAVILRYSVGWRRDEALEKIKQALWRFGIK
jgi:hypothetical protein